MSSRNGIIIVLSGEIGSGKTSLLLNLIDDLKHEELHIEGLISPPVFTNGEKTSIDLVDLHQGQVKRLAELNTRAIDDELSTMRWQFNAEVVDWGNQVIEKALPCQVFIIDELGPLEFERGGGFVSAIPMINTHDFDVAVIVVRNLLSNIAAMHWPDAEVVYLAVENRANVLSELKEKIISACSPG